MGLNFVVREGVRKEDQFRLLPGITVGRSKADITLRDSKVSSIHARIEQDELGELYLVDDGSSNGLWVNGKKQTRVKLTPGLLIKVGETILEVLEDFDLDLPPEERNSWHGKLWSYLKSISATAKPLDALASATLFDPAIELKFIYGPQAGTIWHLGYGPRQIGRGSPDLSIDDPEALDVCFELVPQKKSALFKTAHPDRVRLNDRASESETLKEGDIITFGDNKVRVFYKLD